MMFPKSGSKTQVQKWFVNCGGGEFEEMHKPFVGLSASSVLGLSIDSLQKELGVIRGEALYNAIHKHDRAATTGTAATGRCFGSAGLMATLWCVSVCF